MKSLDPPRRKEGEMWRETPLRGASFAASINRISRCYFRERDLCLSKKLTQDILNFEVRLLPYGISSDRIMERPRILSRSLDALTY